MSEVANVGGRILQGKAFHVNVGSGDVASI